MTWLALSMMFSAGETLGMWALVVGVGMIYLRGHNLQAHRVAMWMTGVALLVPVLVPILPLEKLMFIQVATSWTAYLFGVFWKDSRRGQALVRGCFHFFPNVK